MSSDTPARTADGQEPSPRSAAQINAPREAARRSSPVSHAHRSPRGSTARHHKSRHAAASPDSGFILTERIGKGSFATVYKGEWGGDLLPASAADAGSRPPRQQVAIKVVQRSHLKREKRLMDIFEAEMAILKRMKHPHVVHLFDVVQTSADYNLIMEYCSIGDLSSFIRKKQHLIKRNSFLADVFTRYPSEHAGLHPELVRHFLAQLACSLEFLKQHDIVHRDVKPHNLLLTRGASSAAEAKALGYVGSWSLPVMKIADFGFARFLPSTSMAETLCGSPLYMAPEILNYEKYNAKADLWSVGAVTYEMVTGKPPFPASNHMELIKKIDEGKDVITFPFDADSDLQDIVRGLLKRSPAERLSFEEFFARTAWSEAEVKDLPKNPAQIEKSLGGRPESEKQSGDEAGNRVEVDTGSESAKASMDSSSSSSRLGSSSDKSGYSAYLRRHGNNVAVESASPSPESSQLANQDADRTPHANRNLPASVGVRAEGSENEYVFIEKRTVEVNSLADDLQTPSLPQRRLTNPESETRSRRRLSSIAYGASPTSALAQALLKSSARLFGAKVSSTSTSPNMTESSIQSPLNAALASPKTGERQITDELEQLATIAKVVILYADVKFSQLELEDQDTEGATDTKAVKNQDTDDEKRAQSTSLMSSQSGLYPMPSPSSHIDPYFQLSLARESLSLHIKALSILARAMNRASEWWEQHQYKEDLPDASPGINTLVQWIRDKFNECIERAESERGMISKLSAELSGDADVSSSASFDASAERLLFDRALEMAKAAAVQEMAALSAQEDSSEAATTSEMNYGTAVWMLKALLISENPEDALGDDDRVMVDTLMAKIAQRLATLRRRLSAAHSSASGSLRWNPSTGSPGSHGSQRSLRMAVSQRSAQLTPP